MTKEKIKRGKLLLAEPFMLDTNFKRAVILLCEHAPDGSLGFILNRSLDMKINELVADFPEFESAVHYGGPVQTDTIHYLHRKGELLEDSTEISPGVFWGGDFEQLKVLISNNLIQPKDIRFFVGYSGWTDEQLRDEMRFRSWLVSDMDINYLYNTKISQLWRKVMQNKGDAYTVIAQMPAAAMAN